MAEALAEYVHRQIRSDLGLVADDAREIAKLLHQGYRGSRYSFGYPACPDLSQQATMNRLLGAERIGDKSIELKKFSDVTGLSVTQIKGLTKAGAELGVGSDEITTSLEHFSIGLNEAITATDRRHAERALRRFGMFALRKRTLAEMSYGQARRILFARAWAREPRLALLDEPFAGLDRATRADLTRRLNQWLADGGSCVIATHHREEWPAHGCDQNFRPRRSAGLRFNGKPSTSARGPDIEGKTATQILLCSAEMVGNIGP
jgi:hypothetical protein